MSKRILFSRVSTTLTFNTEKASRGPFWDSERSLSAVGSQNGRMSETTSWGRLGCQNPSHAYWTPSKLSAILWVLLGNPLRAVSQKSRFFLVQRNFPLYTRGLLGCLLGFWPSGPKPCGGQLLLLFPLSRKIFILGIFIAFLNRLHLRKFKGQMN